MQPPLRPQVLRHAAAPAFAPARRPGGAPGAQSD